MQQANGKDGEIAPGERKGLTRKKKSNHAKKVASGEKMDEDAEEDEDDDDEDEDEDMDSDVDPEDKVTDDMMLPAHLR